MNITEKRVKDFENMMHEVASLYDCQVRFTTSNTTVCKFEISSPLTCPEKYECYWVEAPNLTIAALRAWAHWFSKHNPPKTYYDYTTLYVRKDLEATVEITHTLSHSIKNVIFNDPATIVFWHDGTKTVVKCGENDIFDPEKGLAMAISKKFLGNQGNYYNEIKKWVGADLYMNEKTHNDLESLFDNITVDALAENMRNLLNRLEGRK